MNIYSMVRIAVCMSYRKALVGALLYSESDITLNLRRELRVLSASFIAVRTRKRYRDLVVQRGSLDSADHPDTNREQRPRRVDVKIDLIGKHQKIVAFTSRTFRNLALPQTLCRTRIPLLGQVIW